MAARGRCCGIVAPPAPSRGGRDRTTFLANRTMQMYGNSRKVDDALAVFYTIARPNRYSWSIITPICAHNGLETRSFLLFQEMQSEGIIPDKSTFLSLLSASSKLRALAVVQHIHSRVTAYALHADIAIATSLVCAYGKCGSLKDAYIVFDNMHERNVVAWTAMISACSHSGHYKEALLVFKQMESENFKPNIVSFLSILNVCAKLADIDNGKEIHERIVASGLDSNIVVANALINMYGKCSSPNDAHMVFDKIVEKNVVSWTAIIAAYAENGHGKDALELLRQMHFAGIKPDRITLLTAVDACARLASLEYGRLMHSFVVANALHLDVPLGNALVSMYGKCGSLKNAQMVFGKMNQKNVITWTVMIAAYVQNGDEKEAFKLFAQMQSDGVKPDRVTLLSTLDACATFGSLENGRAFHQYIIKHGFDSDVTLNNALVSMYGKCGNLRDASLIFSQMAKRDVASWNAMIAAYLTNGCSKKSLELFHCMNSTAVKPDKIFFLSILHACTTLESLEHGEVILQHIGISGFKSDVDVRNAIMNMYGKCGNLRDARVVFNEMCERSVISWNTMIAVCVQNDHAHEAIRVFRQMDSKGEKPDKITFLSTIGGCARLVLLEPCYEIHEHVVANGFDVDITLKNALASMYGKCGSVMDAWEVFCGIQIPDIISCNTMITAFLQNGYYNRAFMLYKRMDMEGVKPDKMTFCLIIKACGRMASLENGKLVHQSIVASELISDIAVGNTLINMYKKCGSLKDAQKMFDEMHDRNVISWNTSITAYAQTGCCKEALEAFSLIPFNGIKPDRVTFLSTLVACTCLASLENAEQIHSFIVASGFHLDYTVCNALINTYGKCGNPMIAQVVFDQMDKHDVVSFTTMVAAYSQSGHTMEALQLVGEMENMKIKPNKITFLAILNACSHSQLFDAGWQYFVYMSEDYRITPWKKHYMCMIDLLGRAGCLSEAEDLIINMPYEPSCLAWNTLLACCRIHGDLERGIRAAKYSTELDPNKASSYVLLSNQMLILQLAGGKYHNNDKEKNELLLSFVMTED